MAESVVFNALRMVHHKKDAPLMKKRTVYQREKYTSEAEHQDGSVFKKQKCRMPNYQRPRGSILSFRIATVL